MSFETTSASFLRPYGEPTPEVLFREAYYKEKAAKKPSRARNPLDASAIEALRAIELANVRSYATAI